MGGLERDKEEKAYARPRGLVLDLSYRSLEPAHEL